MRPTIGIALVLTTVALTGCGGRAQSRQAGPLTDIQVRNAFAAQGLRPNLIFDTRTASQTEIDRIAPSTDPIAVRRAANAYSRVALESLRARGAAHPLTWLSYPLSSEDGNIDVFVWGRLVDATAQLRTLKRQDARSRAEILSWLKRHPGGTATVSSWRFQRLANVVVIYLPSAKAKAMRVRAALAELARTT
jgi:hypothetical protein